MTRELSNVDEITALRDRGALFVVNHSGGKDSQAMTSAVLRLVPANQVLVIYATLGDVTWEENLAHIKATVPADVQVVTAQAVDKDGNDKFFFDLIDRRRRFPDNANRWCTSDLKRGPIEREIRRWIADHGLTGLVVNAMGLRAEESANRAKVTTLKKSDRNSKAGREWFDWCPIHAWTARDVFQEIADAGQTPHWIYSKGLRRNSCSFCIYSSPEDMKVAAKLRPELFARYVAKERELDFTLSMPKTVNGKRVRLGLEAYAGITVQEAVEANARIRAGLEVAGTPVNLLNPYGDGSPEASEPCDDLSE